MTKGKGCKGFKIDLSWKYSDDTVMHIATSLALINCGKRKEKDID